MNPSKLLGPMLLLATSMASASDHLDTPSVIADPRADIGDLFAWTSADRKQLNLAMTIVGKEFSDRLTYAFHIDSGKRLGTTSQSTVVECTFASEQTIDCRVADSDRAAGNASDPKGLLGRNHRFRVFAGLRDDPFFNNVKGTREAYDAAATALSRGIGRDAAGCPRFDAATSATILDRWQHTQGGPAKNFLEGWATAALVVSIDLDAVNRGGNLLAIWGTTSSAKGQIDRMGRPLTANALLATLGPEAVSDALKERYNAAVPSKADEFVPEIAHGLAFYDGFDGQCGNQFLIELGNAPEQRYWPLAKLLADDRLWVNSAASKCSAFLAVELATLDLRDAMANDCGGRTLTSDAIDIYRSVLMNGKTSSVDDGIARDDRSHSLTEFPFLAPAVAVSE
jgi:hypothetical protein